LPKRLRRGGHGAHAPLPTLQVKLRSGAIARLRTRQFVRGSPASDPRREVDNRIEHRHEFSQRGGHLVPTLRDHLAKAGAGIIIDLKRAADLAHGPSLASGEHVSSRRMLRDYLG
jgi:hypothetical protein